MLSAGAAPSGGRRRRWCACCSAAACGRARARRRQTRARRRCSPCRRPACTRRSSRRARRGPRPGTVGDSGSCASRNTPTPPPATSTLLAVPIPMAAHCGKALLRLQRPRLGLLQARPSLLLAVGVEQRLRLPARVGRVRWLRVQARPVPQLEAAAAGRAPAPRSGSRLWCASPTAGVLAPARRAGRVLAYHARVHAVVAVDPRRAPRVEDREQRVLGLGARPRPRRQGQHARVRGGSAMLSQQMRTGRGGEGGKGGWCLKAGRECCFHDGAPSMGCTREREGEAAVTALGLLRLWWRK